jgi:hypothetical protein
LLFGCNFEVWRKKTHLIFFQVIPIPLDETKAQALEKTKSPKETPKSPIITYKNIGGYIMSRWDEPAWSLYVKSITCLEILWSKCLIYIKAPF